MARKTNEEITPDMVTKISYPCEVIEHKWKECIVPLKSIETNFRFGNNLIMTKQYQFEGFEICENCGVLRIKKEQGFTLTELLICLAILSILVGLAYVSYAPLIDKFRGLW